MKIGSLFSGTGALDLAVEAVLDAETVWHCEYDDAPAKILAHHWPDTPNHRDVTTINWDEVEPVDILTGGYPCQPFSAAGQRKGKTDERHLWPYVREAIRRIRPRFAFLENVAGHRSLGFDQVLADCAADGLHVRWTSLRASDIGAPHHRERIFILVSADPDGIGLETGRQPRRPGAEIPQPHRRLHPLPHSISSGRNERRRTAPGEAQGRGTHSESDGRGAGVHWGKYAPAIRRWGRVVGPAPAPTESNSKGNPRLTSAFSEWMMGLPAGWITDVPGLSRADQLKAAGNGVVPQQAAAALTQLLRGQA